MSLLWGDKGDRRSLLLQFIYGGMLLHQKDKGYGGVGGVVASVKDDNGDGGCRSYRRIT